MTKKNTLIMNADDAGTIVTTVRPNFDPPVSISAGTFHGGGSATYMNRADVIALRNHLNDILTTLNK